RRAGRRVPLDPLQAQTQSLERAAERTRTQLAITLETKSLRDAASTTQRAQRSLKLLCNTHGARGGHLFLFGERGLTRVDSLHERDVPDRLRDYLTEYLAHDHDDVSSSTTIAAHPSQSNVTL